MNKVLGILCFFMVAMFAFAPLAFALDGKLQLVNKFHNQGADYRPMIGLNLHQHILGKVGANLWVGSSEEPLLDGTDVLWMTAKGQVDLYFKDLSFSPGIQHSRIYGEDFRTTKEYFYIKLEYKLF